MIQKFNNIWVRFSDINKLTEGDFIYLKNNGIAYVNMRDSSLFIECIPNNDKTSFKYNTKNGFLVYDENGKFFDIILFVSKLNTDYLDLINDIDNILNFEDADDDLLFDDKTLDTYKSLLKTIFNKHGLGDVLFTIDYTKDVDGIIIKGYRPSDDIVINKIFGSNEIFF